MKLKSDNGKLELLQDRYDELLYEVNQIKGLDSNTIKKKMKVIGLNYFFFLLFLPFYYFS